MSIPWSSQHGGLAVAAAFIPSPSSSTTTEVRKINQPVGNEDTKYDDDDGSVDDDPLQRRKDDDNDEEENHVDDVVNHGK